MTNAPFASLEEFRDVESLNFYAADLAAGSTPGEALAGLASMSRDNARTPVQWDASATAGFTSGAPWIAVNTNASEVNAASQYDVAGSVFEHYRALIALRHARRVVSHGTFHRVDAGDEAVFAFERELGDERMLVVANLSSDRRGVTFAPRVVERWAGASPVLSNLDGASRVDASLRPWEAKVFAGPAIGAQA